MSGLYCKFLVYKTKPCACPPVSTTAPTQCAHTGKPPLRGELVIGCFVLRPQKDPAARAALRAYAEATDNPALADDLLGWLDDMKSEASHG